MARPVALVAPLVALLAACGTPPPAGHSTRQPPELFVAMDRDARGRDTVRLEVELPYSDLVFERDAHGFRSRLLLHLELLDGRGQPTGGDAWRFDLCAADYGETRSASRRFRQTVALAMPPDTRAAVGAVRVLGTTLHLEQRADLRAEPASDVRLGRAAREASAAGARAE